MGLDEVDVGEKAGGGDDDDDRSHQIAGGEAEDERVSKLSTSSIQDVRQDDGECTDKRETADDHVDNVARVTDAFMLECSSSIGGVVGSNDTDGRIIIASPPGMLGVQSIAHAEG